jgi:predicted O-methyltransferase YrrM
LNTRVINRIRHKLRKHLTAPRVISALCAHSDPQIRAVGAAFQDQRNAAPSAEERNWFEHIESLRAELSASEERVEVPDFGAGSPEDGPRSGVQITTEIIGEACRNYSKSQEWSALLFHLVHRLHPKNVIELGTCLGISAAYQGAALELNGAGAITTLEGAPSFAHIARRNFERLGLGHRVTVISGPFDETLDDALRRGPVDFAYIDGHHDEAATVRYFEQFLPHLSPKAALVFDDIAWSSGMARAWKHIRQDSRMTATFDLESIGICLFGSGSAVCHDLVLV